MRTKIVATLGPSSDSADLIEHLIVSGMDVARINCSHATHQEIRRRVKLVRRLAAKHRRRVRIMQDLQGPRLRVGELPKSGRVLRDGEIVTFSTNGRSGKNVIHIDDPYLHSDIQVGHPMFLSSGQMELAVTEISGSIIKAKVVRGGHLFSRKAVNVPGTKLTTSGLTKKDIADVAVGQECGVDYVALSFVQTAEDVKRLRAIIGKSTKIIAKIEMAMALPHMSSILEASDGIMVGRGDLGSEMPVEDVPFIQKHLVRQAIWHAKPSIVATQMLISMTDRPQPTRAEVSDVANAVLDGADAVMLSDETASGNYPVEALQTMVRIVARAEHERFHRPNLLR